VPPGEQTSDLPRVLKAVAIATGQVTVTVPAGQQLMLDASRRIIENPLLLNEFSPDGLDILKMSFIAMDEREEGLCDKALGCIWQIKSSPRGSRKLGHPSGDESIYQRLTQSS
jgi:hypothetical protein